jgi:uncharacterized protein YlaN (UPF0358 family)
MNLNNQKFELCITSSQITRNRGIAAYRTNAAKKAANVISHPIRQRIANRTMNRCTQFNELLQMFPNETHVPK